MKVWLIADTHFNHDRIATYCDRPEDFTERIMRNWQQRVAKEDCVIHLGDVAIGNRKRVSDILGELPGRKLLVRGNHDMQHSLTWWMEHGFDGATDGMIFRNTLLSHRPALGITDGITFNIHGHLHNVWHGFHNGDVRLYQPAPYHRLFALEYTDYAPIEFQKFIYHPKKYLAVAPEA